MRCGSVPQVTLTRVTLANPSTNFHPPRLIKTRSHIVLSIHAAANSKFGQGEMFGVQVDQNNYFEM